MFLNLKITTVKVDHINFLFMKKTVFSPLLWKPARSIPFYCQSGLTVPIPVLMSCMYLVWGAKYNITCIEYKISRPYYATKETKLTIILNEVVVIIIYYKIPI